jgi:hypothetical protein
MGRHIGLPLQHNHRGFTVGPRAEELAQKLNHERARLLTALEGVDADLAARRAQGTEGWSSIQDAMKHVASAEASMVVIAQRTLAGTHKRVDDFDLNRFNARQVEKRGAQTWDETLAELHAARAASLAALAEWSDEQLALSTHHPVWGDTDIGGLFRIIAIHDSLHRKDVEMLRQATAKAATG